MNPFFLSIASLASAVVTTSPEPPVPKHQGVPNLSKAPVPFPDTHAPLPHDVTFTGDASAWLTHLPDGAPPANLSSHHHHHHPNGTDEPPHPKPTLDIGLTTSA